MGCAGQAGHGLRAGAHASRMTRTKRHPPSTAPPPSTPAFPSPNPEAFVPPSLTTPNNPNILELRPESPLPRGRQFLFFRRTARSGSSVILTAPLSKGVLKRVASCHRVGDGGAYPPAPGKLAWTAPPGMCPPRAQSSTPRQTPRQDLGGEAGCVLSSPGAACCQLTQKQSMPPHLKFTFSFSSIWSLWADIRKANPSLPDATPPLPEGEKLYHKGLFP